MQNKDDVNLQNKNEIQGVIWGVMAVVAFSVTLPATRLAVSYIDPTVVGVGRSLFVSFPALILLYYLKVPVPTLRQWFGLSVVVLGVVIGFPWLTSLSMQNISGAQGGIIVSLLPLFTAIAGAIMLNQKPSYGFWLMAIFGSGLVILYLMLSRDGGLKSSEFVLLGASILCAIGYAQGGKLAHDMGGLAVICWALVLSSPFSFLILIMKSENISAEMFLQLPWQAWLSFFYLSIISQWIAFMMWYKGLALGGVVRVSQVQLVQPFFTLIVSAILLGESISALMIVFAVAVVITVGVGRRMPVSVVD